MSQAPTPHIFTDANDEALNDLGIKISADIQRAQQAGKQLEAELLFLQKASLVQLRKALADAR
jgi:hypothetical protein